MQFQYTLAVIALNLNDPCGQGYRKVMKITNYLPINGNVTFHAVEPPFQIQTPEQHKILHLAFELQNDLHSALELEKRLHSAPRLQKDVNSAPE